MLDLVFLLDSVCLFSHQLSDGLYYKEPLKQPGNRAALKGTVKTHTE